MRLLLLPEVDIRLAFAGVLASGQPAVAQRTIALGNGVDRCPVGSGESGEKGIVDVARR